MHGNNGFLGPAKTAGYRPSVRGLPVAWPDHRGLFRWDDVERMRRDPRVQLGLRVLKAPLYTVTWEVQADRPEVAEYVGRELRRIWERDLSRLLLLLDYGRTGGEVTWEQNEQGQVVPAQLRHLYPFDVRPLEYAGELVGIEVGGWLGSGLRLGSPRFFYLVNEPEFNPFYGRSRLESAWEPWQEKRGRHGAVDARRLWYVKNAFRGGLLRHPEGTLDLGDGEVRSCKSYAEEVLEKFETGGILTLPNARDEQGSYLWEYTDPQANGDVAGVREYVRDLDAETSEGLGVLKEILEAADTGSGWAGRSVPFLVYLTGEDEIASNLIRTLDAQVLRRGVEVNFGGADYQILPKSLVPPAVEEQAKGRSGAESDAGEQLALDRFDQGDWQPFEGDRGGRGWRNARTGTVVYGDRPGGDGAAQAKPAGRLAQLAARAKELPAAVRDRAVGFVKAKYEKFAARYGERGAKVVLGAVVALTPVPLPGTSLLPVALAEGVLALRRLLGPKAAEALALDDLPPAELAAAVRELLEEFYRDLGGEPPELTDEAILQALEQPERLALDQPEGAGAGPRPEDLARDAGAAGAAVAEEIRRKIRRLAKKKFPSRR